MTDFQNEEGAKIPARHLALTFRALYFFFALSDSCVKSHEYTIFEFSDEFSPY